MEIFSKRRNSYYFRIQGVQRALEVRENQFLIDLEKGLKDEYEKILIQKVLWYQKSLCKWNLLWDKNTKYFYTITIIHRRKNKISSLKCSDREWCIKQESLKS